MINLVLAISWLSVFAYVAWVCACGWAVFVALALLGLLSRKALLPVQNFEIPATNTYVSILLPVRNEANRILAQSVSSILAQDYEQFEVIAVNDRSTDETSSILHAIAKTDERLRVIEGSDPPAGWLGKSYALQQALEVARGNWILTADADMVFEKEAVSTALGHALAKGYDVLTLVPGFETASFWEQVFTPAWLLFILGAFPFALINHPKVKHAMAFGGFTLVRREALARIGDFASVRGEIVEDIRLAELLKESGARYRIEHAPNLLSTRMQNGLGEIWSFLARGMFAGMRYSLILSMTTVLVGVAFVVAPVLVAIFCGLMLASGAMGEWLRLFIPTLIIWLLQMVALFCVCLKFELPARYALTTPLGLSLFYAALLVSVINILRGKGVVWKARRVYEHEGVPVPARVGRRRD